MGGAGGGMGEGGSVGEGQVGGVFEECRDGGSGYREEFGNFPNVFYWFVGGSACGSSFLDPLVLFWDVPGMGFEGGQMGLQKRVLNFEGFVRVKKLSWDFMKNKFQDMTLKELRNSNARVSDWGNEKLEFRQVLYAISDSEMLLRGLLVGVAVEMELRGYMKEEVSGMEVLQSWWGLLVNRKLDMSKYFFSISISSKNQK